MYIKIIMYKSVTFIYKFYFRVLKAQYFVNCLAKVKKNKANTILLQNLFYV